MFVLKRHHFPLNLRMVFASDGVRIGDTLAILPARAETAVLKGCATGIAVRPSAAETIPLAAFAGWAYNRQR